MADSVVVSPSLIAGDDVQAALSLTRKGGTCVLTGMTKQTTSSIAINLQEFILWNKNLVGTVFGSCNPQGRRRPGSPGCMKRACCNSTR